MSGRVKRARSAIFEASWAKPELRRHGHHMTAISSTVAAPRRTMPATPRCYVFRDGQIRRLTEDHSGSPSSCAPVESARPSAISSKFRHVITKLDRLLSATRGRTTKSVPAGDLLLLCSDAGPTTSEHGEIERIVAMTWYAAAGDAGRAGQQPRRRDNITVVVGWCRNAPP